MSRHRADSNDTGVVFTFAAQFLNVFGMVLQFDVNSFYSTMGQRHFLKVVAGGILSRRRCQITVPLKQQIV